MPTSGMSDFRWSPPGPAMLFCPADRPERYNKAAERADVVILDLEDAVAPDRREAAREALVANQLDPDRTIVRINASTTGEARRDLAAIAETTYRVVMVAKAQTADEVARTEMQTIALIETPLGAVNVNEIAAAPNVIGLMWGAEDLVAGLGGSSSRFSPDEPRAGTYRDLPRYVRAAVRLAAAANDRFAVDAVHLDIDDVEGLRDEVLDAVALGYHATACIHPSQVVTIRDAYRPTAEQIEWATALVTAADDHSGVFTHDGKMIDGPVLNQARAVLTRAGC
ncbi:MAG TPA: CoA ester lyase [Gordonia sp. (in: high G+C Gram-positive bacteria)]|uniref:HpcH/HpaI aldolase/citrate lyase family protein n=1 Tax=unclassified Gordonia (in: high G+C Gram-positive bacteria) TaxID=2657482 RepID=UPI000FC21877|nr:MULTISPECIES: CoA ester lyase [unclassified Gordonia (in: high G+C Gram-positive bacteria)]RTL08401.1 MAG: CoA ester lyase [Acidimicrobiia bacterium]HNP58157.1 CoA ester lyase [Gordonia sp. (in: high G+C Gram-positive bacteria)]HRC51054.1 CoA ester lyase [Gordonia sp. (in: high G+C Gram-positive bacteria)]